MLSLESQDRQISLTEQVKVAMVSHDPAHYLPLFSGEEPPSPNDGARVEASVKDLNSTDEMTWEMPALPKETLEQMLAERGGTMTLADLDSAHMADDEGWM